MDHWLHQSTTTMQPFLGRCSSLKLHGMAFTDHIELDMNASFSLCTPLAPTSTRESLALCYRLCCSSLEYHAYQGLSSFTSWAHFFRGLQQPSSPPKSSYFWMSGLYCWSTPSGFQEDSQMGHAEQAWCLPWCQSFPLVHCLPSTKSYHWINYFAILSGF